MWPAIYPLLVSVDALRPNQQFLFISDVSWVELMSCQKDEKAMDRPQSQNRNPEKGQTIHKDEEDQKATRYKKV